MQCTNPKEKMAPSNALVSQRQSNFAPPTLDGYV